MRSSTKKNPKQILLYKPHKFEPNQISEQSVADTEKPKKFGVTKVKPVVRGKKKSFSNHFFFCYRCCRKFVENIDLCT